MRKIYFILCVLQCVSYAFSQQLFKGIDAKSLSDSAANKILQISQQPEIISVVPIKIDFDAIKNEETICVDINSEKLFLDRIISEIKVENDYTVAYVSNDTANVLILSVFGSQISCSMWLGSKIYYIEKLHKGEYALAEINPFELCETYCPTDGGKTVNCSEVTDASRDIDTISLLILYTNDVALSAPSIVTDIRVAIAHANLSLLCSGIINYSLVPVYIGNTNYSEPTPYVFDNMSLTLDRFKGKNDGFMDDVHTLRNKYAADVCVLICIGGGACGIAKGIGVNEEEAFCVSNVTCAKTNHTVAHEIGHLIGCRHEIENDSSSTPFAYGHGYSSLEGNFKTIMAINSNLPRKPIFSSPSAYYDGYVAGNSTTCNNARVWNERAGAVANFRNPLLFTIGGSDLYKADYAYLYSPGFVMELGDSAVVKSGSDVTIVSGQILLEPGFHAEQGSTFHAIANNGSNSLTQTKTPTIQNETEYSTDIPNASGIRCSVFPNPTNENSQVMLELDRDYHTMSLSITDITGRSIYHLVSASPLERGAHYYQLPFSCLPNGVLFLTFYSGTEKCTVRIIK